MKCLIYQSVARPDLGQDEIFTIVSQSAHRNGDRGLTGFLTFRNGRFLQVLEGEAESLESLFEKVRRDPRHSEVETLFEQDIEQRCFPAWRMKRLGALEAREAVEMLMSHQRALLPPVAVRAINAFLSQKELAQPRPAA